MATCLHHPKKIGEGRKYKHKQRKREAHAQRVAPRSNVEKIVVLCTIKPVPKDVKPAAPSVPSSLRGEQSERVGSCTALRGRKVGSYKVQPMLMKCWRGDRCAAALCHFSPASCLRCWFVSNDKSSVWDSSHHHRKLEGLHTKMSV